MLCYKKSNTRIEYRKSEYKRTSSRLGEVSCKLSWFGVHSSSWLLTCSLIARASLSCCLVQVVSLSITLAWSQLMLCFLAGLGNCLRVFFQHHLQQRHTHMGLHTQAITPFVQLSALTLVRKILIVRLTLNPHTAWSLGGAKNVFTHIWGTRDCC